MNQRSSKPIQRLLGTSQRSTHPSSTRTTILPRSAYPASPFRCFSGKSPAPVPAVVFFDGGCPLCAREIGLYQRMLVKHDISDLSFVDLCDAKVSQPMLSAVGVTHDRAMARMHALDSHGNVQSGARAFITMWEKLPYWKWLAKIVAMPGVTPAVEGAYGFWAQRRQRVTRNIKPGPGGSCRS